MPARRKRKLIVMRLPPSYLLLCLGLMAPAGVVLGSPAPASHMAEISVATLQLPQRDDPVWEQRRDDIARLLGELRPDVISVHQVMQEGRRNPACWLAIQLRYSCDFITADPPSQPERHGSAMLSRMKVEEDGVTLLHPPGRYSAAGMMRLSLADGSDVAVYVARLRPQPDTAINRQHQANDLMAWIAATSDGRPSLISGDFAASSSELVRSTPGFQPSRRNPSARVEKHTGNLPAGTVAGHGMDVLFQVKSFIGLRQQRIELPAGRELPALPLGVLATLRLQPPENGDGGG